ncbi:MAG: N-6 DNA methylase, partial [Cetobacterium sp.]
MITGEIKNKVDQMWEYFWTGGLTNPIDVIEQLTYLMFMKRLDIEQMSKEKTATQNAVLLGVKEDKSKYIYQEDQEHLRWSRLLNNAKAHELIRDEGIEFLKNLSGDEGSAYSKYMKNAVYKVPNAKVLKNTMDVMEVIFSDENFIRDRDAKGDLYEYLLSKLSISGTNGQFRTPKHIINMMVELMSPTPEDIIIDPACGTAGFLASSVEYLMKKYKDEIMVSKEKRDHFNKKAFNGNDTDATMLGISAMNLMLHNVESPVLNQEDSLSTNYKKENE